MTLIKGAKSMESNEAIEIIKELGENCPTWQYEACRLAVLAMRFKSYFDPLYGCGLEIQNWHMNGDTEPFDNFYEEAIEEAAVDANEL